MTSLPSSGKEHHNVDLQHRGDLVQRRIEEIVQRGDASDLPGVRVERFSRSGAASRGEHLAPHAGCEVAADDRHDEKKGECRDVRRLGNGESVKRRQKEEIIGKRSQDAREKRREQTIGNRDAENRADENQIDRLDTEKRHDKLPDGKCSANRSYGDQEGPGGCSRSGVGRRGWEKIAPLL